MPTPLLRICNDGNGTPRQPVPLRYACLVTAWSPGLLLTILGRSDPVLPTLQGHECSGSEVRACHASSFRTLLASLPQATDQLRHLPHNQFVWSDELATAFSDFIDATSDRESEAQAGTGLIWDTAIGDVAEAISECVDLSLVAPRIPNSETPRESGKAWTRQRDKELYLAYQEMQDCSSPPSDIKCAKNLKARPIARCRNNKPLSFGGVLRIISKMKRRPKPED